MSRKDDLEHSIRESYKLIREFEDILRLSDNPKEQARSRRGIEEQQKLIKGYLNEYVPLCKRLSLTMPEDIAVIANSPILQPPPDLAVTESEPQEQSRKRPSSPEQPAPQVEHVQPEHETPSLEQLGDIPKRYLWGLFVVVLVFLIGLLEGLVGIFDVSPYPRRLALTILTALGGGAILSLSFLPRYRTRYQNWDRGFTLGLLVIATGALGWLTYQERTPANHCPTVTLSASPVQITPGDKAHLTAKFDDPENDSLDYLWEATAAGLQDEGGPYKSPLNEYTAPSDSAGQVISVKVVVDDHHCGREVEASTVVRVLLPSGTDTPTLTPTPANAQITSPTPFSGPPEAPLTDPVGSITVRAGQHVAIRASARGADRYEWRLSGEGQISDSSGNTILYTAPETVSEGGSIALLTVAAYNDQGASLYTTLIINIPAVVSIRLDYLAVPAGWQSGIGSPESHISLGPSPSGCHTNSDCFQVTYEAGGGFGGMFWWPLSCGAPGIPIAWEVARNCGINVLAEGNFSDVDRLTFWARGDQGKEVVEFRIGGGGMSPIPGQSLGKVMLKSTWEQYEIYLGGVDLTNASNLFAWITTDVDNPQGAVFYLDDIQFEGIRTR